MSGSWKHGPLEQDLEMIDWRTAEEMLCETDDSVGFTQFRPPILLANQV